MEMKTSKTLWAAALALAATGASAGSWEEGFGLSLEYVPNFEYSESLMDEDGHLWGLRADYVAAMTGRGRFRLYGSYLMGETDYDGQTQAGEPATSDTDDRVWEAGLEFGRVYGAPEWHVVPYLGVGVRHWDQDLHDGETASGGTALGYERDHRYFYASLGADVGGDVGNAHWFAGAAYQPLLGGSAGAELGNGADMDFNGGYGLRLEAGVGFPLADGTTLTLSAYHQKWDIDDSDVDSIGSGLAVYEPANETTQTGVRAGLRW